MIVFKFAQNWAFAAPGNTNTTIYTDAPGNTDTEALFWSDQDLSCSVAAAQRGSWSETTSPSKLQQISTHIRKLEIELHRLIGLQSEK